MKRFTFNVVWTADQHGTVEIEAETLEEARALFRDNPEYYRDIKFGPTEHDLELLDLIEDQDPDLIETQDLEAE